MFRRLVLALLLPAVAHAASPDLLTFQGRLLDDAGGPIHGQQTVLFSIYGAADGGSPLWTETHPVSVADGTFSVVLGALSDLDAADLGAGERWLGVAISGAEEMRPRTPLRSVPYALVANDAATVDGKTPAQLSVDAITAVTDHVRTRPLTVGSLAIDGAGEVIDAQGRWTGDDSGLVGPQGPAGPAGPAGPSGSTIFATVSLNTDGNNSYYECATLDVRPACADADGCTIRMMLDHKTSGSDEVRIIDQHIYMENSTTYGYNASNGLYGYTRQSGGGDRSWISGNGTNYTIADPWSWGWILTYGHSNCQQYSSHTRLPAGTLGFMANPSIRTRFVIFD